jgi:FkbM family methyltransferase
MNYIELERYGVRFKIVEQEDPELDNFWKNVYKNWESETYTQLLPLWSKDKVFVDIGAWQGPISLIAQKFSKLCICFEPDPKAYEYLTKNIEINKFDNIIAINSAVSSEPELYIGNDKLGGGGSSFLRTNNAVKCNTVSFPKILKTYSLTENNISAIKIDIEGYEIELLKETNLQNLNVPKHISLHRGFFDDKNKYDEDMKNLLGLKSLPDVDFCTILLNKI